MISKLLRANRVEAATAPAPSHASLASPSKCSASAQKQNTGAPFPRRTTASASNLLRPDDATILPPCDAHLLAANIDEARRQVLSATGLALDTQNIEFAVGSHQELVDFLLDEMRMSCDVTPSHWRELEPALESLVNPKGLKTVLPIFYACSRKLIFVDAQQFEGQNYATLRLNLVKACLQAALTQNFPKYVRHVDKAFATWSRAFIAGDHRAARLARRTSALLAIGGAYTRYFGTKIRDSAYLEANTFDPTWLQLANAAVFNRELRVFAYQIVRACTIMGELDRLDIESDARRATQKALFCHITTLNKAIETNRLSREAVQPGKVAGT